MTSTFLLGACPDDRERLLANGEMRMPVYSGRAVDDVAPEIWRVMTAASDLMGICLSEPVVETGPADHWGGRLVTVRCGCWDDLVREVRQR